MHSLNQLKTQSRSGTMTVAGTTTSAATNVTVNGATASRYADNTFAKDGVSLTDGTNTFTAIAQDSYGRTDSNTVSVYLPASVAFVYDGNGNLRTNGTRILEYDDENQLIRITEPNAWKSELRYDGKMRRRERSESVWNGSAWLTNLLVRYAYDGNLVIQERHYNPQLSTLTPQQLATYTRGRDLSGTLEGAGGIGGLLARTENWKLITGDSSAHAYYHTDGNGNVTALVNDKQLIVARYLYDPYGNELSAIGPLAAANLYRFSSKEQHGNSALYYYGYRFYHPNLQRWINRDPIQEKGGGNLYAFVRNKPLDGVDRLGLEDVDLIKGWFYLCGADYFDPSCECCRNGVVFSKKAVGTGVKKCNRTPAPGEPDYMGHQWIKFPDGSGGTSSAGFNAPGNANQWSSPDPFQDDQGPTVRCPELTISPCTYDIQGFLTCIRNRAGSPPSPKPFDCGAYVNSLIDECKRTNKF